MAVLTGITLPIVLAVGVLIATVVVGPFQEDFKEGVSISEPSVRVGIEESWNDDVDMGWVFDQPLSAQTIRELTNLPSNVPSVVDFAATHGGIRHSSFCFTQACDAARTRFKLSLTGRRRGEVRVTDIVGRVLERRNPPTGSLLSGPTGGSEEIEPGMFVFGENPTVERLKGVDEDEQSARPYFDQKFVHLALNEPIVFEILAVSTTWDIDWELVVKLMVDGKAEEVVVKSDGTATGKPFRNPGKIQHPSVYKGSFKCEVGAATCAPMRWS
ncbi:hypothetical protein [Streptosporangium roseum]|uniref:hypothetical protein n=1 Tax=Streptosporangium roseum TaxID=2001 RepID=UPI00331CE743